MRKGVGPDRFLRQTWLDVTAGMASDGHEPATIAAYLESMLAEEIQGAEARVKTRLVLTRLWVTPFPEQVARRDEALELWRTAGASDRLWLHWGLLLSTYAAFFDLAGAVGRLLALQSSFSADQVRRRMTEQWGQREIIEKVSQLGLRSLLDWGVLTTDEPSRSIQATSPIAGSTTALELWLLTCALPADGGAVPLDSLLASPQLFPFRVTVGIADILNSGSIMLERQGGGLDVARLRGIPYRELTQARTTSSSAGSGEKKLTVARTATRPPKAHRPSRVYLVACVSQKKETCDQAQYLYTSALFTKARAYALRHADRWYILSAKHGLVPPEEVIDPYETT